MAPDVDDDELVMRAIGGESQAFGWLYERHCARVTRFVAFRVRDPEAVQDLTQDIFMRALKGLGELRQPERFGVWLMRIAHNRVRNYWRDSRRQPGHVALEGASEDDSRVPPIEAEDLAGAIDRDVRRDRLVRLTAGLSAAQQQVLALRFVAGLSVAETAQAMDRSEQAVKQLQYRALAELRRLTAKERD